MSIARDELADWLKALRDFVDHYNPHLLYFPAPSTENRRRRRKGDELEGEREDAWMVDWW